MDRRHVLAVSGALLAGALAGCTEDSEPTDTDDTGDDADDPNTRDDAGDENEKSGTKIDDPALEALISETNGFAFDLYGELLDDAAAGNLFVSPVSISIALAMTYAGARGATREQMAETMRYTLDDETLHTAFEELQRRLDDRGAEIEDGDSGGDDERVPFELSIVNSVWGQAEYPFEDSYLDTLETHYGGGLREVDYIGDAEGARGEINDWVADETEDRIEELLPAGSIDTLTRLVLVNAVYFLANWKHMFPEDATSEETFTALDGSDHEVSMMQREATWNYADVDGTEAVELPYVGEGVSMLLLLPPEGEFESYERSLDSETLAEVVATLDSREGTVSLPRFEFEAGFELGTVLEQLGMSDAFDPERADFSGIAPPEETGENLYIWEVYHETFVAVDEKGTEATAATAVVIGDESAPADPFEFVADRPFLFAIRDRPTGTLLFVGRAIDPAGWE